MTRDYHKTITQACANVHLIKKKLVQNDTFNFHSDIACFHKQQGMLPQLNITTKKMELGVPLSQ